MDINFEGTVEIGANIVGNRGSKNMYSWWVRTNKNTYLWWVCTCYHFTTYSWLVRTCYRFTNCWSISACLLAYNRPAIGVRLACYRRTIGFRRTMLKIVYSCVKLSNRHKKGWSCTDTVIHFPATANTSTILVVRISKEVRRMICKNIYMICT